MRMRRVVASVALICGLLGTAGQAAAADQVIFLVRHAERADAPGSPPLPAGTPANDPPLSAAGQDRAKRLAALLSSADVKHIFITEYQRTRQTAAPLAEKLAITAVVSAGREPASVVEQVRKASGNVLIVGHSNTVPDLLKRFGVTTAVSIDEGEYDNLFVVVRPASGEPTLIRLRY